MCKILITILLFRIGFSLFTFIIFVLTMTLKHLSISLLTFCTCQIIHANNSDPYINQIRFSKSILNDSATPTRQESQKIIYTTIHGGYSIKAFGENLNEIKFGLYARNKAFMTGISSGFQRTLLRNDTAEFKISQVPLYFSNLFILNLKGKSMSPFIRCEFGTVLSESVLSRKSNSTIKKNGGYKDYVNYYNQSNMLINLSLGIMLVKFEEYSGFTLEVGYKKIPTRIPPQPKEEILYFAAGFVF